MSEAGANTELQFGVLGPVQISRGCATVPLRGSQPACVLAVLLLDAGAVVAVDRIIDTVWGDSPPAGARGHVQVYVSRLRKALGGAAGVRLSTAGRLGYQLDIPLDSLDLHRFRSLVAEAGGCATDVRRVELLAAALALWRGEPLAGSGSRRLMERVVPALAEERLAAVESEIAARIRIGQHREVIPRLATLVADHPARESLAAPFMQALHRSGRTDEALSVFRDLRARLIDELGVEPAAALQELHRTILTGTPAVRERDDTVVPAQLPVPAGQLIGRADAVRRLRAGLASDGPTLAVVAGPAGAGKTTLAVHIGDQLRDAFPDGQLYADLGGASAHPAEPGDVIAGFLRALGVPDNRIPPANGQRAGLYRSVVARRRVLVLLDDAANPAQIRPLIPGGAGCAVLVTSRSRLSSLDANCRTRVGTLRRADAVGLLASEVDPQRLSADPAATDAIIDACGQLPLALRIAGRRLAIRPQWTVRALADRLIDVRERLDELAMDDVGVRASLELTYQQLDAAAARAFRLLSLVSGPDVGLDEAASLLELARLPADRLIDRLCDVHLLVATDSGRFQMHDLVRVFAAECCAAQDPPGDRAAAVGRLAGCYLAGLRDAITAVAPGITTYQLPPSLPDRAIDFAGRVDATEWLDRERPNIVAAFRSAAELGLLAADLASRVAGAFGRYADQSGHLADWTAIADAAFAACRAEQNLAAEGAVLVSRGVIAMRRHDDAAAVVQLRRAVLLLDGLGERTGATALNNLAVACERLDLLAERGDCLQRAYETYRALADERGQVVALGNLGDYYSKGGEHDRALATMRRCLALANELDSPDLIALAHNNFGESMHRAGHYVEATSYFDRALRESRQAGIPLTEWFALIGLARMLRDAGRPTQAIDRYEQAMAVMERLGGEYEIAEILVELGDLLRSLGHHQRAETCWRSALETFDRLGVPAAARARLAGLVEANEA